MHSDPVSSGNVQVEQDLMQNEAGDLAGAIGLVTLLERSGYVVRRRRRKACWKLRIRGHGESWYATGKTAEEALEAAVRRMVPGELGRVLLSDAIAENGRNAPSARVARDAPAPQLEAACEGDPEDEALLRLPAAGPAEPGRRSRA